MCSLTLAGLEVKRGREWLAWPFMLPREVTKAEWHQSFSLDKMYKFKTLTAKTIPALNNDLKFFLLHTIKFRSLFDCSSGKISISKTIFYLV